MTAKTNMNRGLNGRLFKHRLLENKTFTPPGKKTKTLSTVSTLPNNYYTTDYEHYSLSAENIFSFLMIVFVISLSCAHTQGISMWCR